MKLYGKFHSLGRNIDKTKEYFKYCWNNFFEFIIYDINEQLIAKNMSIVDYVIHLVNNIHTVVYTTDLKYGNTYSIDDDVSHIMFKDLAQIITDTSTNKVGFELSDELEKAEYSKTAKVRLTSNKLKELGGKEKYNFVEKIHITIEILSEIQNKQ